MRAPCTALGVMPALTLVLLLMGCGTDAAVSASGPCVARITAALERLQDTTPPAQPTPQPGLPPEPTPPFDPDACTPEDRQTAARLVQDEFEGRLLAAASEGTQPLGADRAVLNLLALLSLAMTAPPTFTTPAGWPTTFPVHPDADVVSSTPQPDSTLHADWIIVDAGDPAGVVAFYDTHLQQGLPGRWDSPSAQRQQTQGNGTPSYANTYQVTGPAHRGTVTITGPDDDGDIHVRADLQPDP